MPRIIVGDNRQIGADLHGAAHQRTLLPIAIARHRTHRSRVRGHAAQRIQARSQGIGRMSVIDKDAEGLPALQAIEPTGHKLHGLNPTDNRGKIDAVDQPTPAATRQL